MAQRLVIVAFVAALAVRGLHLNAQGYALMAPVASAAIAQVLK